MSELNPVICLFPTTTALDIHDSRISRVYVPSEARSTIKRNHDVNKSNKKIVPRHCVNPTSVCLAFCGLPTLDKKKCLFFGCCIILDDRDYRFYKVKLPVIA